MTHYDILGVPQDASPEEIKSAYRNLIKAFHPDYYRGDKAFANRKTDEVTTAYHVLRDPNKRMEYDLKLLQERHRIYYSSEPQNNTPPPPPKKESPPPPPPKKEEHKPRETPHQSSTKNGNGRKKRFIAFLIIACCIFGGWGILYTDSSSQKQPSDATDSDTEETLPSVVVVPRNLTRTFISGEMVRAYAYDKTQDHLFIWFTRNGAIRCYFDVSNAEYAAFINSHDVNNLTITHKWTKAEEESASTSSKPTTDSAAKPTATPNAVKAYSGMNIVRPDYVGVCPLEIKADNNSNYYIYLDYVRKPSYTTVSRSLRSDAYTPYESDFSFYVEAGDTVEVDVPIGIYKLYYATGDTYYGKELLFGANTQYYSSDELLEFYASSQYYEGVTLTLYSVYNGNYDTDPINASEFPS